MIYSEILIGEDSDSVHSPSLLPGLPASNLPNQPIPSRTPELILPLLCSQPSHNSPVAPGRHPALHWRHVASPPLARLYHHAHEMRALGDSLTHTSRLCAGRSLCPECPPHSLLPYLPSGLNSMPESQPGMCPLTSYSSLGIQPSDNSHT